MVSVSLNKIKSSLQTFTQWAVQKGKALDKKTHGVAGLIFKNPAALLVLPFMVTAELTRPFATRSFKKVESLASRAIEAVKSLMPHSVPSQPEEIEMQDFTS